MALLKDLPSEIRSQVLESLDDRLNLYNAIYSTRLFKDAFRLQMIGDVYSREISRMQRSRGLNFAMAHAMNALHKQNNMHAALMGRGAWDAMSPQDIPTSLLPLAQELAARYDRLHRADDALAIQERCWQVMSPKGISTSLLPLAQGLAARYDRLHRADDALALREVLAGVEPIEVL
jgi:hypothetical protein